jgi:phosphoadenosine phosphosulfate reductase
MTAAVRTRAHVRPFPTTLTDSDLTLLADELEEATADEIVAWAAAMFGRRLVITASMTDAVLIDLASRIAPGIEVVFLDTGYHFPETLATAEQIRVRYPVRLRVMTPRAEPDDRWRLDPDGCCQMRKVAPLERAMLGRVAWMSGLRRADSADRATTPVVQRDRRNIVKVNPLARWTDEQVEAYIAEHDVVVNPLVRAGYPSIGCWPCTRAIADGEPARAGRWDGTLKTECGLHW